jgi:hypothetical protein
VEHVERQEEREQELRDDADRLEQQGDEMQQRGEELEGQIGDVREEFERKQQSEDVPGALEPDAVTEGERPPPEADATPEDEDD